MKKEYKFLITVIIVEICCLAVLGEMRISVRSLAGKLAVIILLYGPVIKLLYMLSKDEGISLKKRRLSKAVLIFLTFCLISGGVGEIIKMVLY